MVQAHCLMLATFTLWQRAHCHMLATFTLWQRAHCHMLATFTLWQTAQCHMLATFNLWQTAEEAWAQGLPWLWSGEMETMLKLQKCNKMWIGNASHTPLAMLVNFFSPAPQHRKTPYCRFHNPHLKNKIGPSLNSGDHVFNTMPNTGELIVTILSDRRQPEACSMKDQQRTNYSSVSACPLNPLCRGAKQTVHMWATCTPTANAAHAAVLSWRSRVLWTVSHLRHHGDLEFQEQSVTYRFLGFCLDNNFTVSRSPAECINSHEWNWRWNNKLVLLKKGFKDGIRS